MPEDLPRMFRGGFGFWSGDKLAAAVEKGVITQAQADALQAWYDGKPEDLPDGFGFGHGKKFGRKGRGFSRGRGHHGSFEKEAAEKSGTDAPQ